MFDVGFTEMVVIAVVALIVIGPERLPGVARTIGHLLGRLQRYVSDVKSDVQREMRLEELKKLQAEVETQARGIERTVVEEMKTVESNLAVPAQSLSEVMTETGQTVGDAAASAKSGVEALVDFDPARDIPQPPSLPPPAAAVAPGGSATVVPDRPAQA